MKEQREQRPQWWAKRASLPTATAVPVIGGALVFWTGLLDPDNISPFAILAGLAVVAVGILLARSPGLRAEAARRAVVYIVAFAFIGLVVNRLELEFWQRLPVALLVFLGLWFLVYWLSSLLERGGGAR